MAYDPLDYLMNQAVAPAQPPKAPDPITAATNQNRVAALGSYFPAANTSTLGAPPTNGRFQFGPGSFQRYADDRGGLLNDIQDTFYGGGQTQPTPTPTPTPQPASRLTMDAYRDRYGWMT